MEFANLRSNYWKELRQAARGDRSSLLAKLRSGETPTRLDLRAIADLIERRLQPVKLNKGRQKKTFSKYYLDHEPMINASREYANRVSKAGGPGAIRGQSESIFKSVASEHGIADWRALRTFYRQSKNKRKVDLRS